MDGREESGVQGILLGRLVSLLMPGGPYVASPHGSLALEGSQRAKIPPLQSRSGYLRGTGSDNYAIGSGLIGTEGLTNAPSAAS